MKAKIIVDTKDETVVVKVKGKKFVLSGSYFDTMSIQAIMDDIKRDLK